MFSVFSANQFPSNILPNCVKWVCKHFFFQVFQFPYRLIQYSTPQSGHWKALWTCTPGSQGFAVSSFKESWLCGTHITSKCGHNYSISKYTLSESLVVFHKTARLSNCNWISQHGVMETAPLLMFLYYLYLIPWKEILPHPLQGQIHATVRARFLITDWVVSIQDCHKESIRSSICQSHIRARTL